MSAMVLGSSQKLPSAPSWSIQELGQPHEIHVFASRLLTSMAKSTSLTMRLTLTQMAERLGHAIPPLELEVAISRVLPWTQSIRRPILFEELGPAGAGLPAVRCFEYREGVNPFTQETFRIRAPGVLIQTLNGLTHTFHLTSGAPLCSDAPRPLPPEINILADRLKAEVIAG
jgi:hypothetical protein